MTYIFGALFGRLDRDEEALRGAGGRQGQQAVVVLVPSVESRVTSELQRDGSRQT